MASRIRLSVNGSPCVLSSDPRVGHCGYEKCMQCGRCTASCPAAYAFGDYSPRMVMSHLLIGDIDGLSDYIWKCGQCYSCRARCPRNNSVGEAILALRERSIKLGTVPDTLLAVSHMLRHNLYNRGETFLPQMMTDELLSEFGPATHKRCSGNSEKRVRLGYLAADARAEPIPPDSLGEIRYILNATGCGEVSEPK